MIGSVVMASAVGRVLGFQASPMQKSATTTSLKMVAVDPSTVTKKEYEDICGVSFDGDTLEKRLHATNYLYPKHVEVIEDIAPIAGEMVDSIVSLGLSMRVTRLVNMDGLGFCMLMAFHGITVSFQKHAPIICELFSVLFLD